MSKNLQFNSRKSAIQQKSLEKKNAPTMTPLFKFRRNTISSPIIKIDYKNFNGFFQPNSNSTSIEEFRRFTQNVGIRNNYSPVNLFGKTKYNKHTLKGGAYISPKFNQYCKSPIHGKSFEENLKSDKFNDLQISFSS